MIISSIVLGNIVLTSEGIKKLPGYEFESLLGLYLCLCLVEGRYIFDASKLEALPLPKKHVGGYFDGVWHKKVDHGKYERYVLKEFLIVHIPSQYI